MAVVVVEGMVVVVAHSEAALEEAVATVAVEEVEAGSEEEPVAAVATEDRVRV